MVNKTLSLEELKNEAVRVYNGMIVFHPQSLGQSYLDVSELTPKFNGCYAVNNSTACFVSDGEVYVIPRTRAIVKSLCIEGFKEEKFQVPFSNWDYPIVEVDVWERLRNDARKIYAEEFAEDAKCYCEDHGIGELDEEILENCFEMPIEGVHVRHVNYDTTHYPIITSGSFECNAAYKIGRYCTNNGKVVFTYCDGKTYVTKGYGILKDLQNAGYTEARLYVPFSNGEEITDPALKERWDAIVKKS